MNYKQSIHAAGSDLERTLAFHLRAYSVDGWEQEYRFTSERDWRFDFCWPALMLAVECDGGTKDFGRHNRPEGYEKDCEKLNFAAGKGWRVMRFTSDMVNDGRAIIAIKKAIRELSKLRQEER